MHPLIRATKMLGRASRAQSAIGLASAVLGLAIKSNILKEQLERRRRRSVYALREDIPRFPVKREERKAIEPQRIEIPFKAVGGTIPHKANEYDGGDDLALSEDFTVPPHETVYAPTGIKIAIPPGYIGFITERSSVGKPGIFEGSEMIWVRNGVIDPGFRGEVKLRLYNFGDKPVTIPKGTRLAQIVYIPVAYARYVFKELPPSERGEKGFGSSGIN